MEKEGWAGTVNYFFLGYSEQVHLNRQIHLFRQKQIQLKGLGNPTFKNRHLEWRQVPPLIRFLNQRVHPTPDFLGSLEAVQVLMHNNCFHRSGRGKTAWGRDESEMERVRNIVVFFPPQLNCLSNPSQWVTQFICLKSIGLSQCETLSQHKTGPLIILFRVLSLGCSRLSLIFSYFQSIIIFYRARTRLQKRMCAFHSMPLVTARPLFME